MTASYEKSKQCRNILRITILVTTSIFVLSCEKTPDCEMKNTGTLIIENTSRKSTLQVFFNENGRISVNGPGDLNIAAGETQTIDIPAGQHNIKAKLLTSTCSGSRCMVSSKGLPEKDVDLDQCEQKNLIY